MEQNIQILEKPDWVSWNDIRCFLFEAHTNNRAKGINMTHYQWSAEKIRESLGEKGIMLVALEGKKLVGTAGIAEKFGKSWYARGRYAYMCYAGVLPEYSGRGIYKALNNKREEIAKELGYHVLSLDTHRKNKQIQEIALKNGYKFVRFFMANSKDHYSVVMVKWLNGCPYSKLYCWLKFQESKVKALLRSVI